MAERMRPQGSAALAEEHGVCLRQFALMTFQEYTHSPHGESAEDWVRERLAH